jgi:hypothetical protein
MAQGSGMLVPQQMLASHELRVLQPGSNADAGTAAATPYQGPTYMGLPRRPVAALTFEEYEAHYGPTLKCACRMPTIVASLHLQSAASLLFCSSCQRCSQTGSTVEQPGARRCDAGACAHHLTAPCASHKCACCKTGRQSVQYSRQGWCGPCGKREVVGGLKFVRCGR